MSAPRLGRPLCLLYFLRSDRMRPRFAKPESCGGFLGGKFGRGFHNRAQWIAYDAGVFPVGVVDAPEPVANPVGLYRAHVIEFSRREPNGDVPATQCAGVVLS